MKTITVKGVGKASAPVDSVELSFRLQAKNRDYDQAVHDADQKLFALENALCAAGFPAADFQTAGFHVDTEYENVRDEGGNYHYGHFCSKTFHRLKHPANF